MHIFIFILFSSFEIKELGEKHFDAVDLIETAFNKLADNAVSRKVYLYTKKRTQSHSVFISVLLL